MLYEQGHFSRVTSREMSQRKGFMIFLRARKSYDGWLVEYGSLEDVADS